MDPNQIRDLRIFTAKSALSQRIADATHDISEIRFFIAEIELASGITGQGYLLSFHYFPKAVAGALADTTEFIKQFKTFETVRMARAFREESEYFGNNGLLKWVQGALNIAMWDAWGKVNNRPIWQMLGACCDQVPVYGSGGWLSYSDEELIREVKDYKERGFRAVKIKVGAKEPGRDLHRLNLVRDTLGDDLDIMMDANQGMDIRTALDLSEQAKLLNIRWFEEPIVHTDFAGYETIRNKAGISLAMGEREYDMDALKQLIARNAIDLWQPDLLRIGGVESWRESAAVAHAHHIPVLPHYYKDYDVPLLCTIPNGYGSESFDWIDELIDNRMEIRNGMAEARTSPGWGFSFLHDKMTEIS